MKWFWEQYLQDDEHHVNPYAVPAIAQDFTNLAPAIVITAEFDPLLSDGEKYAQLLQRDGVQTSYRRFDGMIHGFFTNMAVTPVASQAIDFVANEIIRLISRGTESEQSTQARLDHAKDELSAAAEFDHVVINHEVDRSVSELVSLALQ